ncbi:MAG: SDR family NAD(P)-dependent oxidoreductase [Actinomycetota bacterium]
MTFQLKGAVGIVTGASRGIGARIAERLAGEGMDLALAARSEQDLQSVAQVASAAGVRAIAVATDVNDAGQLRNLVDRTVSELGPPALLVNNAGVEKYSAFQELELDDIDWMIRTNVTALAALTRLTVPHMIQAGRGHIVNMASLAGKTAVPYNSIYSASKHAVVGFSWSLREELRPLGIGVSAICPGFVEDTGMFASRGPNDRAPKLVGTVSPGKVVDETIKAIRKNRAEVIVAPPLSRVVDVLEAISPDFATSIPRRTGLYDFLAREGDRPKT